MTVRQVMAEIERDVIFYDESGGGVTISGGEPLLQHGFLLALLQASKEMEIHTVLDTCGFATWEVLDSIRHYVDLFLYDLKLMDDTRHLQFTGVSNHLIIKNLETLSQLGHEILVRVPIIPGITDDDDNIRQIGTFIATLQEVKQIDTLPYHAAALGKYDRLNKAYKFPDISPPEKERIFEITETLQGYGLQVNVGG
jgi:pyruvate formate lyase activating enzyme